MSARYSSATMHSVPPAQQCDRKSAIDQGLRILGWRAVPTDSSVCGDIALASLPAIEQVFVDAPGIAREELGAKLFVARRKAEIANARDRDFYICSLSGRVIAYKGLVMPVDLPRFYLDLADERLETAICVFHQRFSTNTMPRWPLAQPFRLLAHNGEINTIEGNRNWADAHGAIRDRPAAQYPGYRTTGKPHRLGLVQPDNMLDLLLTGGVDMARALRMLIPRHGRTSSPLTPT